MERDHPDEPTVPISALLGGNTIDPDLDMVTLGVRVPKYVADTLRTYAFLTGQAKGRQAGAQQRIVCEALKNALPKGLLSASYTKHMREGS